MNPTSMREALKRKKTSALDITILVGGEPIVDGQLSNHEDSESPEGSPEEEMGETSEEEKKEKELGLAPKGTVIEDKAPSDPNDPKARMEETLSKSPMMGRNSLFSRMKK